MLDLKDLNKRVRALVRTLLDMPANTVSPADQNAPTGSVDEQFATVRLSVIKAAGNDEYRYSNKPADEVEEAVVGQRWVMASVNIFRGDAYSKAQHLIAMLSTTKAIQLMQQLGLGLVNTSQARNLSTVSNTLFEERGQIDIELYVISDVRLNLPTYGIFEIDLYAAERNPDGTFPPPQVIEVTEP